jgi:hypothetical protein
VTQNPKQDIGEYACGFCGLEGCLTQLQEKKKGSLSAAYHNATMNYKAAAKFFKAPMSQCIVHCAPLLSLDNHKPYGYISLISLVPLPPLFQGFFGSDFYHKRGGKGSGYSGTSHNKLVQAEQYS